jgi:hypothetical protein
MIKKKRKTTLLPRGSRKAIANATGLSIDVVSNHIYGKHENALVQKEINKILKRKR